MDDEEGFGGLRLPRRRLLAMAAGGVAALWASCTRRPVMDLTERTDDDEGTERGRLLARPGPPSEPPPGPGVHALGLEPGRDGVVFVPAAHRPDRAAPLLVALHGAGGTGRAMLEPLQGLAEEHGMIVLSPDSRGRTWDVLVGGFGPDAAFLDRALAQTFARHTVDAALLAVGGFSDGASYALSVGLTNGDLFGHVLAFSPGFAAPGRSRGRPRVYVSHGTHDAVLPVASTSRVIVPRLRRAGYEVRYHEFDGPHAVPPDIAREATAWFLSG